MSRAAAVIDHPHRWGPVLGLTAACLFGVSAPFAKLLLSEIGPLTLASLLYLGAGLGLLIAAPGAHWKGDTVAGRAEAALRRGDLPLVAGAVLTGGILGPLLLMVGLERVSAVSGSLLMNLEPPLTIFLAVVWFREHLGLRQAGATALILAGASIVAARPGDLGAEWLGVAAIAGSSLSWAIDTNLSQLLSARDPVALSRIKGLAGGACLLAAALVRGERPPSLRVAGAALFLGWVCYGMSAVLFVRSLRLLGAARVAAYFATAPFLGALAAVPVLGERLTRADVGAMLIMAGGVVALMRETHDHAHAHEALEHDHAHLHDDHHRHDHPGGGDSSGPHAHPHRHVPLVHAHPHAPDLHHRHDHD